MAIGNINSKIVNRTTKMCVVDSQCQYPFMVACLLNAVSLLGKLALQLYFNATPSVFCKFNNAGGVLPPPWGKKLFFMFSVVIVSPVYYIFQLHMEFAQDNVF